MSAQIALDAVRTLPGIVLAGLFVGELVAGIYARGPGSARENWLNGLSFLQDRIVVEPLAVLSGATLWAWLLPDREGFLAAAPFWSVLPVFALCNDFAHYWFHRWAHTQPLLWRVHATHHTATQMCVAATSRLNVFWRLIYPTTYLGAFAVYAGQPEAYFVWWAITGALNFLVHSAFRWDLPLYEFSALRPLGKAMEAILITPDVHHAHHGNGKLGAGNRNFGQALVLWDRLFGTLVRPHARQDAFGAEGDVNASLARQLLWPFAGGSTRR